jgi:hypothetical protein
MSCLEEFRCLQVGEFEVSIGDFAAKGCIEKFMLPMLSEVRDPLGWCDALGHCIWQAAASRQIDNCRKSSATGSFRTDWFVLRTFF